MSIREEVERELNEAIKNPDSNKKEEAIKFGRLGRFSLALRAIRCLD